MDNLNTPYEDDDQFIDCRICEKSIRGDSLYKIHLTSPAHLKKEDFFIAQGAVVRKEAVPTFNDVCDYLDYLNLDEPIIGLNYLEEISRTDPQLGPIYLCRLCKQTSPLVNMVCHLIGRKHRLKYIEEKRTDLVTWDGLTVRNQSGKFMKTKAEIIERQDGRGVPKLLTRRGTEGNWNITKWSVPQRQRQTRDQNTSIVNFKKITPPPDPEFRSYNRISPEFPNKSIFHPDEFSINRNRDLFNRDRGKEEFQKMTYNEDRRYTGDVTNPDYQSSYGDKNTNEPQSHVALSSHNSPRYDFKEQRTYCQNQEVNYYPEKATLVYPEKNSREESFNEEVWHGQHRSHEYPHSQSPQIGGDNHRWSLERPLDRHDGPNRAHMQEPSEPEAKRRNTFSPLEAKSSLQGLFEIVKDYHHHHHQENKTYKEETFDASGPSRNGSSTSQKEIEVSSAISEMPEPFRRFLKGAKSSDTIIKRKSRFSDATPEEIKMMESTRDKYNTYVPQLLGSSTQPVTQRSNISVPQSTSVYSGSQNKPDDDKKWMLSQHQPKDFQKGGSNSQNVFDMLRNIEITNIEEAEFLRTKIGNVLQEFNSQKFGKAVLDCPSRPGPSKSFADPTPNPQLPQHHQFEITLREDSDHRRLDPSRADKRSWQQMEPRSQEPYERYQHPSSNRNQHNDEWSRFTDNFQETRSPPDPQPDPDLYGRRSSFTMEQVERMQRNTRHSNSFDKIASALLELVARK